MKTRVNWLVVPAILVINLAILGTSTAEPVVQITPEFQPDPLVVSGKSGGEKASDCGNISATPSQVIQVTQALPYLRLSVQSAGEPTLLINGPSGRFCVLSDAQSGENPEISGYWQPGKYTLYVGDRSQGEHPYTLSISQQKSSSR